MVWEMSEKRELNLTSCPATGGSGCKSQGCEVFANLAAKSQAWGPQVMGSEGDLSRWVNCDVSYAGTESRLPARDRLAE